MTQDPEQPAPSGPTPEEISARLEALLKRTHALRKAQPPIGPDDPAWPPSDGDLASVEVVDVPREVSRALSPSGTAADATAATRQRQASTGEADDRPAFGRPDWSSLRLRETPPIEVPRTPAWVWLLVAGLVLALGAETAYLLRTTPWATSSSQAADEGAAVPARASVRIEGPPGFGVASNGGAARALPATIAVDAADAGDAVTLVIERLPAEGANGAEAAAVPAAPTPPAATPSTPSTLPASAAPGPAEVQPVQARAATTGAVRIESTPTGAIVTMGGRERGPTPITIDGLRPGRHDVLVVGPAGGRMFRVDVTAGTTARLDAALPSAQ